MMTLTKCLRPRLLLCAAAVSVFGLLTLSGGCPQVTTGTTDGTTTTDGSTTSDGTTTTDGSTTSDGTTTTDGSTTSDGTTSTDGSTTSGDGIETIDGTTDSTGSSTTGDGSTTSAGSQTDSSSTSGDDTTPDPTSLAFQLIVQSGDSVPGQPSGTTFKQFSEPVIDAHGRIAFWGLYSGPSAKGRGGLYVWDQELKRVIDDDPTVTGVVPSRTTADYFGQFQDTSTFDLDIAWGAGDRLLFVANVSGEKVSRGIYRWRATDGDLVRVVDIELFAPIFPEASPGALDPTFILPGVTDGGTAIFACKYLYISTSSAFVRGLGVFSSNGTSVSVLVDSKLSPQTKGNVPDQGASAYFSETWKLTTVNGTDLLFQAGYKSGSGAWGVYLRRGGTAYRVIDDRTGATWTGLAAGAQFYPELAYPRLAISSRGHIAIDSQLMLSGSPRDTVLLWDVDTGSWRQLTGPGGGPATDLVSGVNDDGQVLLLSGGSPYIVNSVTRVKLNDSLPAALEGVTLTWTDTGGAINNGGRAVAPYTRSGGSAGLAFWTGSQLLVAADVSTGVPESITGVSTISDSERDRPGRSGLLNDSNEIVFRVTRSGGNEAIYVARGQ